MKNTYTILATLLLFLFISCDEDENTVLEDNTLIVLKTNLTDGSLTDTIENISVGSPIEIIFSHSLDTDKIESSISLISESGVVDYSVDFSNTNSTVILTPNGTFEYQANYSISLPEGAYGTKGETFENPLSISFSTEMFVLPTITISRDVSDLDEDGQTATITATLNKVGNEDITGTLTFDGTATEGVDYTISGDKAILIPEGSLSTSITITTEPDSENEGNETVSISLVDVTNSTNNSNEITIVINEQLPSLSLKGIMVLTWNGAGGNDGKAIHLVANQNIADLSLYGLGTANNGGGTDGKEYTFPAISVSTGEDILLAREVDLLSAYIGGCVTEFEHLITAESAINQNGDDAIELFQGDSVIETYGDIAIDGTDQPWEYKGSWAYKVDGFWTTGGVDCSVGSTLNSNSSCPYPICLDALSLKGVMALSWDGSAGNDGKAIHLKATKDIPDLSIYGIGTANNGGGTDGKEYTFPAISILAGEDILLAREVDLLSAYFGSCVTEYEHLITAESTINQNGDDAIELFKNDVVIETYGDALVDGTGQPWEYKGSWAYKDNNIWTTGGVDCSVGSATTQSSSCIYPACN